MFRNLIARISWKAPLPTAVVRPVQPEEKSVKSDR